MVHFIREMDGGVEWRTRFWMGYTILNGHPVPLLPPGIRVPEPAVFGLANHNIYENTRLKSLLPLVYEEFGAPGPDSIWEAPMDEDHVPYETMIKKAGHRICLEITSLDLSEGLAGET